MQLHSARISHPRLSSKEVIPYSTEALRQDLQRVRDAWDDCQATRDRNAIYGYLSAVYGLVAWWTAEGQELDRGRQALRVNGLPRSDREDVFAAITRMADKFACQAEFPLRSKPCCRDIWDRGPGNTVT